MSHPGTGDAESVSLRVIIAGYTIEDGESLVEAERRLSDVVGRPMTDEEKQELAEAHARALELEKQHGPDYHGFGHPPPH